MKGMKGCHSKVKSHMAKAEKHAEKARHHSEMAHEAMEKMGGNKLKEVSGEKANAKSVKKAPKRY